MAARPFVELQTPVYGTKIAVERRKKIFVGECWDCKSTDEVQISTIGSVAIFFAAEAPKQTCSTRSSLPLNRFSTCELEGKSRRDDISEGVESSEGMRGEKTAVGSVHFAGRGGGWVRQRPNEREGASAALERELSNRPHAASTTLTSSVLDNRPQHLESERAIRRWSPAGEALPLSKNAGNFGLAFVPSFGGWPSKEIKI